MFIKYKNGSNITTSAFIKCFAVVFMYEAYSRSMYKVNTLLTWLLQNWDYEDLCSLLEQLENTNNKLV